MNATLAAARLDRERRSRDNPTAPSNSKLKRKKPPSVIVVSDDDTSDDDEPLAAMLCKPAAKKESKKESKKRRTDPLPKPEPKLRQPSTRCVGNSSEEELEV